MAERVYPAAKPIRPPPQAMNVGGGGVGSAANGGGGPPMFPATKGQSYAPNNLYRPMPPKSGRRSRRSRCRCCCLWFSLAVVALILLIAIAGAVFYLVYRPHRPSFSVTSLHLSAFNISGSKNLLTSSIDISVTARNPNRKIEFLYDETSIAVSSGGVDVGDGSFPAFVHGARNTTVLTATLSRSGESLDASTAADLRKSSAAMPLEIELDTRAGMKIGSLKTKKLRFRATCSGFSVGLPKRKVASAAVIPSGASCKVSMRIKIWKWTI